MRSIGKITPDILNIFHQKAAVEQKRWILTFLKNHAAAVRRTYESPALLPARTSPYRIRASLFDGLPGHPFLVQLLPDARRAVALAAAAGEKAGSKAIVIRNDAHSTGHHAVVVFRRGINLFRPVLLITGADSFRRSSCSLWSRTAGCAPHDPASARRRVGVMSVHS